MQITRTTRRLASAVAIAGLAIGAPAVALAASGGSQAAPATSFVRCHTGQLTDWIGLPADATAGSNYYELEISNTSRQTCGLYGFPGVSALRGGHQVGSPAARNAYLPQRVVSLSPGATAHFILQITDVENFSAGACHPVTADALKIYAPGAYSAHEVPFSFAACSKSGPVYLHVSTTVKGTGIPGYSTS
jgi:hypothetical protein